MFHQKLCSAFERRNRDFFFHKNIMKIIDIGHSNLIEKTGDPPPNQINDFWSAFYKPVI